MQLPQRILTIAAAVILAAMTAIAVPAGLEAQVTFAGTPTTFYSLQSAPISIAEGASGVLYLLTTSGVLIETPNGSGGYNETTPGTNLGQLNGQIAVDAAGDIFVARLSLNQIVVYTKSGATYTRSMLSGFAGLEAFAVDATGNIYAATDNGLLLETLSGGNYTQSTINNEAYTSVAVSTSGLVYAGATGTSSIYDFSLLSDSWNETIFQSLTSDPASLWAANGGVYALVSSGQIDAFAEGSSFTTPATYTVPNLNTYNTFSLDPSGNILYATGLYANSLYSYGELQLASVNLGSIPVNTTGTSPQALSFNVAPGATIGSVHFVTTGIAGKDFADAGASTCSAQNYSSATTCVVNLTAAPHAPGYRYGAVVINDASGNLLASVPVTVTGKGPQAVFTTPIQTTWNLPSYYNMGQIAVDAAGNTYGAVADIGGVVKFSPTGAQSIFYQNSASANALAMDGAGNLYLGGYNSQIIEVSPSGVATTFANFPDFMAFIGAMAFDPQGNLYAADAGGGIMYKIAPNGTITTVGAPYSVAQPYGMAFDPAGNLYVADPGYGSVYKLGQDGTVTNIVTSSTLNEAFRPSGIAIDAAGTIYITVQENGYPPEVAPGVYTLSLGGTLTAVPSTGWDTPTSIAVDGSGNLFVGDGDFNASSTARVVKLDRSTQPTVAFTSLTAGGSTDTAEEPKAIAIQNIGNQPLTFSSVTYPLDFPEDASGTTDCTASTSLSPAAGCTFTIDFTPQSASGSASYFSLVENLKYATNTLNLANYAQKIAVTGASSKAATTLGLGIDNATPTVGVAYTLTATVTPVGLSSHAPTGTVSFVSGGVTIATVGTVNGVATLQPSLTSGKHTIVASYNGDSTYGVSASNSTSVTISKVTPTIGLLSSEPAAIVGDSITFTVNLISPVNGLTPTGTVNFFSGGVLIGSASVNNGTAGFAYSGLTGGGAHSITATYYGDGNFLSVTSARYTQPVNKYTTTATLTVQPNPATSAIPVSYSVSLGLQGGGPLPTGTVNFYSGGVLFASAPVQGTIASLTSSALSAASHTITAIYLGDANSATSTAAAVKIVITK